MIKVYYLICVFIFVVKISVASTVEANKFHNIQYKTYFGNCPSKVAGSLTLLLIREFEDKGSLKELKTKIIKDKLDEKHFLSEYKIKYDPLQKYLKFYYDCPKPLMKVHIYKDNGDEFYSAILGENGKILDPTYEVLMRAEGKIKGDLPSLAIPVKELDDKENIRVTRLIKEMSPYLKSKIAEVIISEKGDLTIILSIQRKPASIFIGQNNWTKKVQKLEKVIKYLSKQNKIPTIVNLTNLKKVVVKFSDTL